MVDTQWDRFKAGACWEGGRLYAMALEKAGLDCLVGEP